ncbi:MAG: hypothetical protein ACOCXZ_00710 [Chloroflexota bacterium]
MRVYPPQTGRSPGRGTAIHCTQNRLGKSILPALLAMMGVAIFFDVIPNHPLMWLIWTLLLPYMLVYSPDFTVYDNGIEVHFPWRTAFNSWSDVTRVTKTAINARIYARNLTMFNIFFSLGNPWIVATAPGRKNYHEAIDAIKARVGDRFREFKY